MEQNSLEKMKNIWLDYFQPHIEDHSPIEYILKTYDNYGTVLYSMEPIQFFEIADEAYSLGNKKIYIHYLSFYIHPIDGEKFFYIAYYKEKDSLNKF